jgi:hypothetical protein
METSDKRQQLRAADWRSLRDRQFCVRPRELAVP